MIWSAAAVYLILMVAGLIILNLTAYFNLLGDSFEIEGSLAYVLGLTLGSTHSVLKIIMIERAIIKIADAEEKSAKIMGQLYYFGRFIITIAVLVAGAIVPFLGFFGTVVGVFSLRLAAYTATAVEIKLEKRREKFNKSE